MSVKELKSLLHLAFQAAENLNSSQKGSEGKDELSKTPIFEQLGKLVANFI